MYRLECPRTEAEENSEGKKGETSEAGAKIILENNLKFQLATASIEIRLHI